MAGPGAPAPEAAVQAGRTQRQHRGEAQRARDIQADGAAGGGGHGQP